MKSVLITGGAGFIGSNFVRHLLRVEPAAEITNLDALTYAGSLENLKDLPDAARHRFVEGSITDRGLVERLFAAHTFDTVIHFAAESHVDRSILGPAAFVDTNVVGTFVLLDVARASWLGAGAKAADLARTHRFHHVSTDEVFGSLSATDPAFSETTPYDPRSPYSASKAASDHLVRAYAHTYGLPVSISNCSNNYGPYQFPEKLIPVILSNALEGKPLPIYGDGKQVRDWLHVADHCDAIHRIVTRGAVGETYNVGGGNQPTNLELVETLCGLLDEAYPASPHRPHRKLITFVTDRPGHDRRYAMDTRKIERDLAWTPAHDLAAGLRETVAWYKEHAEWVSAIRARGDHKTWMAANYGKRGGA